MNIQLVFSNLKATYSSYMVSFHIRSENSKLIFDSHYLCDLFKIQCVCVCENNNTFLSFCKAVRELKMLFIFSPTQEPSIIHLFSYKIKLILPLTGWDGYIRFLTCCFPGNARKIQKLHNYEFLAYFLTQTVRCSVHKVCFRICS